MCSLDNIWHYKIFCYLSVTELIHISRVSHYFWQISRSNCSWYYHKERVLNRLPELSAIFMQYERKNDGNKSKPKKSKNTTFLSPSGIWKVFATQLFKINRNRKIIRCAMIRCLFFARNNVKIEAFTEAVMRVEDQFYFCFELSENKPRYPCVKINYLLPAMPIFRMQIQYVKFLNDNIIPTTQIEDLINNKKNL